MKHLVIKAAKHQAQLLDKVLEYGMQHQHIRIQQPHPVMKHQLMKNQPDEIDGTKHPKQKEKHRVITVVGLKHRKPIAFKAMVSLSHLRREQVRDDHVGMKHRQMPLHR